MNINSSPYQQNNLNFGAIVKPGSLKSFDNRDLTAIKDSIEGLKKLSDDSIVLELGRRTNGDVYGGTATLEIFARPVGFWNGLKTFFGFNGMKSEPQFSIPWSADSIVEAGQEAIKSLEEKFGDELDRKKLLEEMNRMVSDEQPKVRVTTEDQIREKYMRIAELDLDNYLATPEAELNLSAQEMQRLRALEASIDNSVEMQAINQRLQLSDI